VKSGVQFREEQVQDPAISNIPVIVLSADSNIRAVSEKLGIQHYLRKPVNLEELLESINRVFPDVLRA
jgi:CheY-like chemotaxis protein